MKTLVVQSLLQTLLALFLFAAFVFIGSQQCTLAQELKLSSYTGFITGRVVGLGKAAGIANAGMANVLVQVSSVQVSLADGTRNHVSEKFVRTDANGFYSFEQMPAGVYHITIFAENGATDESQTISRSVRVGRGEGKVGTVKIRQATLQATTRTDQIQGDQTSSTELGLPAVNVIMQGEKRLSVLK
jgi:hypothetical protein